MIHCQKCNADNLIGAVFCRACGVKLELDNLRPKTVDQAEPAAGAHAKQVLGRVVTVVLLVVVVGLLFGFLLPPARPGLGELKDQDKQAAGQNYAALFVPNPKPAPAVFTSVQVSALINDRLGLDKADAPRGFGLSREKLEIFLLPGGVVQVVLKSRVLKKIPLYNSIKGKVDAIAGVRYKVTSAQIGRIPLPVALQKSVVGRIAPLFSGNQEIDFLKQNITSLTAEDNRLTVTMKAVAPPPARAKR